MLRYQITIIKILHLVMDVCILNMQQESQDLFQIQSENQN